MGLNEILLGKSYSEKQQALTRLTLGGAVTFKKREYKEGPKSETDEEGGEAKNWERGVSFKSQ